MSQKKTYTLADKYKIGGEFHDRLKKTYEELPIIENDGKVINQSNPKRIWVCGSIIMAILLILFLAALKNPSNSEGNAQIKIYLVERLKDFAATKMAEDKEPNNLSKGFGRFIINTFAPSLIDSVVDVQISNYVFFSTFKAQVGVGDEHKNLMSGVILFGQIIPISTDLDKEKLKESGFDL